MHGYMPIPWYYKKAGAIVLVAPAHWADYLIHGDPRRILDRHGHNAADELERVHGWTRHIRPWSVRDVCRHENGEPFAIDATAIHDCHGFANPVDLDAEYREYVAIQTQTAHKP